MEAAASGVWHWVWAPWTVGPVRLAAVELTVLGIAGGTLGCWVVLHNLSYAAESYSHGLFPGLVIAALAGLPLLAGAMGGVVLAAVAIVVTMRAPLTDRQTAIAVAVTTLVGLGALLALSSATPPGLQELLFGDVLAVTVTDVVISTAVAVVVVCALLPLHLRLLLVGFDREDARAFGANPGRIDLALLVLLAATVVVAAEAVGVLLAPAIVIGPPAAARLVGNRVPSMMVVAVALALTAGVVGLYLSYYAATAAGASVAGVIVLSYLVLHAATRGRGAARASSPVGGSTLIVLPP